MLVLGVAKTDDGPRLLSDDPALRPLQLALEAIGVTGAQDELRRVPSDVAATESLAADRRRHAANSRSTTCATPPAPATRQLRGIESVVLAAPGRRRRARPRRARGRRARRLRLHRVPLLVARGDQAAGDDASSSPACTTPPELVEQATAIAARPSHTVRDLVNAPPLDLYPETLADAREASSATGQAARRSRSSPRRSSTAGGFGGILGVGQGSTRGPRLVKSRYAPAGAAQHLALVGKGITFDSGGLSLKPPASHGRHEVRHDRRRDRARGGPRGRARSACRSGSPRGCASPRTCRPGRRSGRTTCCASAAARRSRCSTPTPRAASCSPTASSPRARSTRTRSSTSPR